VISTQFRFIYLHVPKTGGNSIQTVLLPYSDDAKAFTDHQDGVDRFGVTGPMTRHKHARLWQYHELLGEELARYRIVVSVREPFERMVSVYFSPHRWMERGEDGQWRSREPVWDEAAFMAMVERAASMASFLRVGSEIWPSFRVIRFESLAGDLRHVAEELGIPLDPAPMPHVNRSSGRRELISMVRGRDDLRARVLDHFREDATLFGYA
jgi:hypothetical protein